MLLGIDGDDGSFAVLADLDGRYLSTEVTGGFIGRVIGLYAVDGAAWFDWFELTDLGLQLRACARVARRARRPVSG